MAKKKYRYKLVKKSKRKKFSKNTANLIKKLMRKNFYVTSTSTLKNPTLGNDKVKMLVSKSRLKQHDYDADIIRDTPFYRVHPDQP